MESYKLSDEQEKVIQSVVDDRKNVLVVGKAGVGKSVTLRGLKKRLDEKGKTGFVLAPTGVAAINVEGMTIHKFMASFYNLYNNSGMFIDSDLDYIIIDEISMVRADLLDELSDAICHVLMRHFKPFGGVQVILMGDPGQLPPVINHESGDVAYLEENYHTPYFYSSASYAKIDWSVHELTKVFRQRPDEQAFVKLLNLVRAGEKVKTVKALNECCLTDRPKGIILCSSNKQASMVNEQHLDAINEPVYYSKAIITGEFDQRDYPTDEILRLKVGAQVMVVKNIYSGTEEPDDVPVPVLVNGDICTITDIVMTDGDHQCISYIEVESKRVSGIHRIYEEEWNITVNTYSKETKVRSQKILGQFIQLPVRLAWAITIHKSQGATFDEYTIDLTRPMFAPYQLYVALSRGTNLEGLNILGKVRKGDVRVCSKIQAFLKDFKTGVGIKEDSRFCSAYHLKDAYEKNNKFDDII